MTNNLAKNGFFPRSIQLDLILDKISIKQIILSCLHKTIAIYRSQNCISLDINRVLPSLSDKVILQHKHNYSSLVYCSAIAFPLANLHNLSSLQVAQDLVDLLACKFPKATTEYKLQFKTRVIKNGLIEFEVCDRSVGFWLERVLGRREDGKKTSC